MLLDLYCIDQALLFTPRRCRSAKGTGGTKKIDHIFLSDPIAFVSV